VAALSPDGKVVAYINDENGQQSIWLFQISTRTDRQLVYPADTKYKGLAFFPNGDYLSYLKTAGDSADLYQVSTFGGSPRKLTSRVDTPVSFSPDGMQFTFVRYFLEEHATTLLIADVNGANERPLATLNEPQLFSRGGVYSSGPAWSPDGKLIAIPAFSVTEKTYREIILVNVADGGMNTITRGRWSMIEKIVWLADGNGFLMNASAVDSQLLQIWLVNLNGDQVRQVLKDPSHYVGLSSTKDSAAVLTLKNERISAVWIKTGESDPVPVPSNKYLGAMGITWTTDGRLVFASNIYGDYEIWTMKADGGNQHQLIFNEGSKMEPAVSVDGRYIVYMSYEGRHPHVWRINADGTNPTQLTKGGDEDLPRFTPDGKWVVYHSIDRTGYSIRKVSIDGGDPITLVSSDYSTQPDVSPDGKQVACLARRAGAANLEILVVPIDGGAPTSTFALPSTIDPEWPGLRWTSDGTEVTYVSTVQGVSNIWGQPLTGGKAKPLTNFNDNRIFFFDWSRNERKLVLVRGNDSRDLLLVRHFLNAK
jgi:TolB protein